MKYLILILTYPVICFSQINGKITYKKQNLNYYTNSPKGQKLEKVDPYTFKKWKEIDDNVKLLLKEMTFQLNFNNNESIFRVKEFLEVENKQYYYFALGPDGSGVYYNNINTKENLVALEAYGQRFLINNPQIKWSLTKETKTIKGFLCYKATTIKSIMGRKGTIKMPIIAWYAPKLPISFGPLGYRGLPGLIFDLTIGDTRYYVEKIKLNPKKKIVIKKPIEGKLVSKDEFEAIGLQSIGKMQNMLNKN